VPLELKIDHLCLGEGDDPQGSYLYLLDSSKFGNSRFLGAVRYIPHERFLECKNMVSDGYGPAMLILVAQAAKRLGLEGASADTNKNSAEAVRMIKKMVSSPPVGLTVTPTSLLTHADASLNVLFSATQELVVEAESRAKFASYTQPEVIESKRSWWARPSKSTPSPNPWQSLEKTPDKLMSILKREYLCKSDEAF
jgi:hypothetical protein